MITERFVVWYGGVSWVPDILTDETEARRIANEVFNSERDVEYVTVLHETDPTGAFGLDGADESTMTSECILVLERDTDYY